MLFDTYPGNDELWEGGDIPFQCYDIASASWSMLAGPPIPDTGGACAVAVREIQRKSAASADESVQGVSDAGEEDESLYIVGGYEGVCVRYSPHTAQWTKLTPTTAQYWNGGAVSLSPGSITVCGGWCHGNRSTNIETYDVTTNTWIQSQSKLPVPLKFHFCAKY